MRNVPDFPSDSDTARSQRRLAPRYVFVAETELTDPASARKFSGTVTEISRKGCYVYTTTILPVGTSFTVRITLDRSTFVTKGQIVYVHERVGMGVLFLDPSKDQLEVLDSWLAALPSAAAL